MAWRSSPDPSPRCSWLSPRCSWLSARRSWLEPAPWRVRSRPVQRLLLRRAAQRYAAHTWPVVPGAWLNAGRFDCGDPGCPTVTCHPARPDWTTIASRDPDRVTAWWRRLHHGVLLATGFSFDVLEVANPVGREVAREVRGPVALAPGERWMFLVRPGHDLHPALAEHPSIVLHGRGSWIPAPPTRLAAGYAGRVRWVVPPRQSGWWLPNPYPVQRLLLRALRFDQQPRRVWRHMNEAASTASRSCYEPRTSHLT